MSEQEEFALRSTRDGGEWELARDAVGDCPAKNGMFAYCSYGSEIERKLRDREIFTLLAAAEAGDCTRGEHADVAVVHRHEGIFELRWTRPTPIDGEELPVHFRLYFAEPPEVEGLLLGLVFHKKAIRGLSAAQRTAEQNRMIDSAAALYTAWRAEKGL